MGKEKGEGKKEFDHEGENGGEIEKRLRELVDEPGDGVGNRLGFEVIGHGREIGPSGVATEDFDDSRAENETKEEEGKGESDEQGGKIKAGWAGAEAGFFEKDNEKADFEEEGVPLKGEEILTDIDKGEPAEPREGGGDRAKKSKGQ